MARLAAVTRQCFRVTLLVGVTVMALSLFLLDLVDEIADEAVEMTAFEDFVTEMVEDGRSILGLYPATVPQTTVDFARWREANGR